MNILVDIVHPADVLFFYNPIRIWQASGHRVAVVSRSKDVTEALLAELGVEHQQISRAGTGLVGLAMELVRRDLALFRVARTFRPDVMCGFGGVAISHVGKLLGIPSVGFYDTGRTPLQLRLTLPFITHLYVPDCYDGPQARGRTSRFPGTKDFSYFHPDNFKPDRDTAIAAGLDPQARNYFLRLVSWQSNHDLGHSGWSRPTLAKFVAYLGERGKVHLSSEGPLPVELERYRYAGPVCDVHHLLAHCDAYFGESATMAGESVLLGVPAVFAASDQRCYTDELAAMGLLWNIPDVRFDTLREVAELIDRLDRGEWERRFEKYLAGKINLADYVVEHTLQHAQPG